MPKNAAFSALILVFAVFALANLDPSYDLISTFDEIDPFETEPSISTDESLIADTYGCSSYNGQSASKLRTRRTKNFCTPKKNSNKDPPQSSSTPQIPASYIEYYPKPILETDFKVDRTICPSSIYGSRPFPVCDSGYPDIYNTLVASSMSFNLKFCIPCTFDFSLAGCGRHRYILAN